MSRTFTTLATALGAAALTAAVAVAQQPRLTNGCLLYTSDAADE